MLTSSQLADALDLSKEDPQLVARYGTGDPKIIIDGNGAPRVPQSLLLARRLVEAGCRVVTLNYSKWDWHGGCVQLDLQPRDARTFPIFDNAPGRAGRRPARPRPGQGRAPSSSGASSAARR